MPSILWHFHRTLAKRQAIAVLLNHRLYTLFHKFKKSFVYSMRTKDAWQTVNCVVALSHHSTTHIVCCFFGFCVCESKLLWNRMEHTHTVTIWRLKWDNDKRWTQLQPHTRKHTHAHCMHTYKLHIEHFIDDVSHTNKESVNQIECKRRIDVQQHLEDAFEP